MRKLFLLMSVFVCLSANAQKVAADSNFIIPFNYSYKAWGLVAGISQGSNTYFELGFYKMAGSMSRCAFGSGAGAVSLSVEYNPFGKVAGAGITAWSSAATVLMLGANAGAYSNFDRTQGYVRPMIGIGGVVFSLSYGRNIYFVNDPENRMGGLNTNMVSVKYYISCREKRGALPESGAYN